MLLLRDYTKVNLANRFLQLDDNGEVAGEFSMDDYLRDNSQALLDQADGVGLEIKVLASMSGVLINRRVYPGMEWKDSAAYFAERPFLMHHNSYGDAVGRIESGEFEQKRSGRAFENDWKRPVIQELGKTPRPSGIVYVTGMITDPNIIEQAKDKRVLHVSQGSRAGEGSCSICGANWADGQWCEHEPGRWYDKETGDRVGNAADNAEMAYTIIRKIIPIEVSFVADPALREARIMEFGDQMDAATEDRWNRLTSGLNTADTILEQDTVSSLLVVDRNGARTTLRLVNDMPAELNTPHKPVAPAQAVETDKNKNHQPKDSADTNPVAAVSSDNGAKKMEWETKYAEKTAELIDAQAASKEFELKLTRAEGKLEVKEAEAKALQTEIEARDAKIAELEAAIKDGEGASKKLLDEVRLVYLDRYEEALKISRPDLDEAAIAEARKGLEDKQLDSIKLLVQDKEKFAKAPLDTQPAKADGDAGSVNDAATKSTPKPATAQNDESEEDSDDAIDM